MANTARSAFRTAVSLNLQGRGDLTSQIDAALDNALEELTRYSWRELRTRSASITTIGSATSTCDGAPVFDDPDSTVKVDDAIFLEGMIGYTLTIGDNDYTITAVNSTTECEVEGNASGEADEEAVSFPGIQTTSLPSNLEELLGVQVEDGTNSYPLALWSKDEAERRYPLADQFVASTLEGCYREEDTLYLVPMPNGVYTLRMSYRAKLTLEATPSATISDAGFDSLIIAFTTAEVHEGFENSYKTAARWWRIFRARIARKQESQQNTGVVYKVNTRLPEDGPPDPRWRDPRIVWFHHDGSR